MISEVFTELFSKSGYPSPYVPFSEEEKLSLPFKAENPLHGFFDAYGRGILNSGKLQSCHPNDLSGMLELIFGDDRQFGNGHCHAYAYTAFGIVYFWSSILGQGYVDLLRGEIYSRGALGQIKPGAKLENQVYVPFSMEAESFDFPDIAGKPLFKRAEKKLGPLGIGECYGFFPALALGGSAELDYLKRVRAAEHFAIVAQTMQYNLIDIQGYGQKVAVRPID